ncbi:MAG: ATP-binding cassette domain-containing protein, partial [Ilumatobacteraceae bacterium]
MSNATISKTTSGSRQSDSVVRVNLSSDSQGNSGKPQNEMIMQSVDLQVHYGDFLAVRDVNLTIHKGEITALIGPSGCGNSTIIRCFNRMN